MHAEIIKDTNRINYHGYYCNAFRNNNSNGRLLIVLLMFENN